MIYKCEFPNCLYTTENRSQIHYHHIVPKELNGNNNQGNLIYLCPNHHSFIYVPECKTGIHSIKHPNSIIIINKLRSTTGIVLEYIDHGITTYYFY